MLPHHILPLSGNWKTSLLANSWIKRGEKEAQQGWGLGEKGGGTEKHRHHREVKPGPENTVNILC